MKLYIGLMSGTSIDGIDAALVDVENHKLIAGMTKPYSPEIKRRLVSVLSQENVELKALAQLNTMIGREFANATRELLNQCSVVAQDVIAIGSHGQTICHDALNEIPYTLQLGCAHTIAEITEITVVADFRTRDLVLGGQGAPFAPLYHHALFKDLPGTTAVVNIGGIANVSFIVNGELIQGFDIGPGNCLMDAWIQKHLGKSYDQEGTWAASGQIIPTMLYQLLADPFFQLAPPKSVGKEYFSLDWLAKYLKLNHNPEDVQATLMALTSHSIAHVIQNQVATTHQLIICGGGTHNRTLFNYLSELLPNTQVYSTAFFDISPDYLEAMLFAWLADKTLNDESLDLTKITGSRRLAKLGIIYPTSKNFHVKRIEI